MTVPPGGPNRSQVPSCATNAAGKIKKVKMKSCRRKEISLRSASAEAIKKTGLPEACLGEPGHLYRSQDSQGSVNISRESRNLVGCAFGYEDGVDMTVFLFHTLFG
jgi:hypothetical protein